MGIGNFIFYGPAHEILMCSIWRFVNGSQSHLYLTFHRSDVIYPAKMCKQFQDGVHSSLPQRWHAAGNTRSVRESHLKSAFPTQLLLSTDNTVHSFIFFISSIHSLNKHILVTVKVLVSTEIRSLR